PLGSLLSELRATLTLQQHEVPVGNRLSTLLLSSFQKEMWELLSGKFPRVAVSAPTSAGKSFVVMAKIVDFAMKKPIDIFYIVPTITLINQVSKDVRDFSRKHGFNGIRVLQSFEPSAKARGLSTAYVLTQERALGAIKSQGLAKGSIDILVIDEVQNIERVANENDERSKDLYNLIHMLENDVN